jgi:predicted nucleic acid-binding protein
MWIEYFNREDSPHSSAVQSLIMTDSAVLAGPILFELNQGARTTSERELLTEVLDALPFVEIDKSLWVQSGRLSADLRKKGATIPMTDCLIAALAKRHRYKIATLDRHFDHFPELLHQ